MFPWCSFSNFSFWLLFTNCTETDLNFYKTHLPIRGNAPNYC